MLVISEAIDLRPLPRGLRLKLRREVLGIRQQELAAMAGLPRQRLSHIERGDPIRSAHAATIDSLLTRLEAQRRQGVAR